MTCLATSFGDFLKLTSHTTMGVALRYAVLAGVAWLLGYVMFKRQWQHRKIIPRLPRSEEVWREIRYSAMTLVIFGVVGAVTYLAARAGWTQLYFRTAERGWVWFGVSIVCAIALHDTYFYWTHRLMHHRRLFRLFHRAHHLSHNPSPWAAYAFSPLEAVVEAAIFPIAVTLIPMHPLAFVVFMGWQIVFNVAGHTGYEFYPRWMIDSWMGRILNTPTNHIMHHESLRGNYGLYFNLWDRLMRTNHENYEHRFREVTSRARIVDSEPPSTSEASAEPDQLPT